MRSGASSHWRLFLCAFGFAICWQQSEATLQRSTRRSDDANRQLRRLNAAGVAPELYDHVSTAFASPQLTPPQFLVISSPVEQKVVYTQLSNFKSVTGRTFPLIDSGLTEPYGIALDRQRGRLYVADRGARKIFHYRVMVQQGGEGRASDDYSLVTDGVQLCILQNHVVEWVAVDNSGDVFFSDLGSNSVTKISFNLISILGDGRYQAGDINMVSEVQLEAISSSRVQQSLALSVGDLTAVPADASLQDLRIYAMYEKNANPNVAAPGGIVSDGIHLYWVNSRQGGAKGTVVEGEVYPTVLQKTPTGSRPAPFPTRVLTNVTESAYGITMSNNMIFYTTNNSAGEGFVYGVNNHGVSTTFAAGLLQPRALVWDGDGTVYVADQGADAVWSFPVGRLVSGAPRTKSVSFRGAFGLALLSADDQAFDLKAAAHGALRFHPAVALAIFALASFHVAA